MSGTHLIDEKPNFFVTSSRPGNFGDHIDFKVNIDNWFDENRYFNNFPKIIFPKHFFNTSSYKTP